MRVGLHGRVEFTHPLFASAVYTSAPRAQRREAHAALAETVGDPEERAHHLALASDGPDEQVAQALEDAGRPARRRGAPDVAAHLTELALKLAPEDDPRTAERRLELAEHLHLAGDFQRAGRPARSAGARAAARRPPRPRACCCWPRSTSGERASRRRSASPSKRRARRRSAPSEPAASRSSPCGPARPTCPERPRRPELRSSCWKTDDADPALLSLALGARVRADLFLGNGLDAGGRRAGARGRARRPAAAGGRHQDGVQARAVAALRRRPRRREAAPRGGRAAGARGGRRVVVRQHPAQPHAARVLGRRLAGGARAGRPDARDVPADRRAGGVAGSGASTSRRTSAGSTPVRAQAAAQPAAPEPIVRMLWERSLGLAALAAGEPAAADEHFRAAMDVLEQMGWREPAVWRVEGDAIEAALGVGDLERAAGARRPLRAAGASARGSRGAWRSAPAAAACCSQPQGQLDDVGRSARARPARARAQPGPLRAREDAARLRAGAPADQAEAEGPRGARGGGRALRATRRRAVGRCARTRSCGAPPPARHRSA